MENKVKRLSGLFLTLVALCLISAVTKATEIAANGEAGRTSPTANTAQTSEENDNGEQDEINATDATVAWPLDMASEGDISAVASVTDAISYTSITLSDGIFIASYRAVGTEEMATFEPKVKVGSTRDENYYVSFTISAKRGVAFKPKKLTLNASKIGTNGGTFDVVAITADGEKDVATGEEPARNGSDNNFTSYEYDISELGELTDGTLEIRFYI